MNGSPLAPHQATPAELEARLAAERRAVPFLLFRDGEGDQRIVELTGARDRLVLGRNSECDVPLPWDPETSWLHAELQRVGSEWLVIDDGLSSNGTFVAGQRLVGRRRLRDGDVLRVGSTWIAFRHPVSGVAATTHAADERDVAAHITDAQRRVLVALCRPLKDSATPVLPATNPQIASELHLSVAAVKSHLRTLCRAFGVDDLPQQEKRLRLATMAFTSGVVSERDL